MTISSTTNRVSFSGNDSTTVFSFPYVFHDETDLVVVLQDEDGVETTQTITTHYTVGGTQVNNIFPSGGTVTMVTAPATGETLVIYRDLPQTQGLDLVENDSLPAESIEQAFDKLTMVAQRLKDTSDRTIRLKETDPSGNITLPLVADRANRFLAFDSDGDPIASTDIDATTPVTAYIETLLDDTDAATARGTLGFSGTGGTVTQSNLDGATTSSSNEISNCAIAASVAGNALTIALKTKAGSDATSTTPITIGFRNVTATTGTYLTRQVTGALSVVVSSGSTLGLVSAVNEYIYVYALDNAGTVELAVMGGAPTVDEGSVTSSTAEGGAGAADTRYTLYSTTARTNVPARLLGRIKSNQAVTGTYGTAVSEISLVHEIVDRSLRSGVIVHTGNGHGSTNTKIRRFTTTQSSVGTAITYADSAANGGSFTINEEGLYYVSYTDFEGAGNESFGPSINSNQLTTAIGSITDTTRLGVTTAATSAYGSVSAIFRGIPGDIVRAHTDGDADGSSADTCRFSIIKIGN